MRLPIEQIIEMVTREVIKELTKRGYTVDYTSRFRGMHPHGPETKEARKETTSLELCMKEYQTPILTEARFQEIGFGVKELIIPEKTIITPGAYEQIKKRNMEIKYQS